MNATRLWRVVVNKERGREKHRDCSAGENQFRAQTRLRATERPAVRVPESRKEPTRQQIENVSGEKPANSARSRVWEQAEAVRCARNYRRRSWSRRTRVANQPCAVFRVTAANWRWSTPQKRRTER